ncbi:MAG: DUF11 domain-containing protein [Methanobacteriota archaeon]|nr:MAG: DUF11 domain-containing protein [Euryarchaeota archaeon]
MVVTFAPMTSIATDPSSPSAWKQFQSSYGPQLTPGTYHVEVVSFEKNGAKSFIAADAVVRSPAFTLQVSPTQWSVLGGDILFYQVWYNNSGSGTAGHVWINATLASEVTFVTSSAEGSRTGPTNWTYVNTSVGSHLLLIEVRVRSGIPPETFFRSLVALYWTDEKEYAGQPLSATADVALGGPVVSIVLVPALATIHQRQAFVMTVNLTNSGDSAGTLWVNVSLPSGLSYVSDSSGSLNGTSTPTPGGVNVQLAAMPGAASWSFDIGVRSSAGLLRGTQLNTTANLAYANTHGGLMPTRSASGSVVVIAPLIVNGTIRLGLTIAVPGDVVPMTVEFENVGDEAAPNVWVNLTVDPRYAFVSASMAVTVQGGAIRFRMSSVGRVQTRVFLNVSVAPAAPDAAVLGIMGTIDYTDGLDSPLPRGQFAPVNVTVTAPRFTLDASPALATMEAGTSAVFTVTPANEGTGIAGDVWLNTTLPSDLEYVSDTSDGQRMVLGSDLVWHWQSLGPGPRPFTLVLSARSTTADQSSADVRLQVQYTDTNGNRRADLVATPRVTFVAPMIQLTLLVSQESAPAGTTFFYTLRARNSGTTTARTLWLLDSLSAQLSLFSYTSSVPATGSSTLNWTFRSLRPGEEQAITLFVRIAQDASPGTAIPNEIEAVFTNSEGTVIGYSQSLAVTVTVVEPQSPLPYIIGAVVAGLAPVLFFVYRWSRSRIEQVFLVTKDGILIDHFSRSLVKDQDGDVLSAMLTAVQQFVKDAFRLGQNRALEEMKFGDFLFLVERGQFVYLAVVTAGGKPPGIARKLRRVLNELEAAYGPVFQTWNGEMEHVLGAKDLIRRRLLWERRSPAKPE